jgi:hypothetical protein
MQIERHPFERLAEAAFEVGHAASIAPPLDSSKGPHLG